LTSLKDIELIVPVTISNKVLSYQEEIQLKAHYKCREIKKPPVEEVAFLKKWIFIWFFMDIGVGSPPFDDTK